MRNADDQGVSYYEILNVPRDATSEQIKRAYRRLAQAYHPDKNASEELRDVSTSAFAQVQQAYEVLSDPQKRQIYDVYGRQGLEAGLEVGPHLDNLSVLRKEWEAFQARQAAQRVEAEAAPTSLIQVKVWAVNTVADVKALVLPPRMPMIANVSMSSSVQLPTTPSTVISLGGNSALVRRATVGGGAVMVGTSTFTGLARWDASSRDALQLDVVNGLGNSQVSLTTIRHLSQYDTGQASLTWTEQGWGTQLVARRVLSERWQGAFTWVLGPASAQGMSLVCTRQAERFTLAGKIEVGAVSSVLARCVYRHSEEVHVRCVARCGTTGIDAEVGVGRRWSPLTSSYLAVVHGFLGTTIKVKVVRAGHAFEVPLVLSKDYQDWQTLIAAYTLPPLISYAVSKVIVAPLLRWHARRNAAQLQAERSEALAAAKREAVGKQALLAPMVRRLAAAEMARGGLVILRAGYGDLQTYPESVARELCAVAEAAPAASAGFHFPVDFSRHVNGGAAAEAATPAAGEDGDDAAAARNGGGEGGEAAAASGRAEPWLDVSTALQYLVEDGRLALPQQVPKSSLLGFADLAPDGRKALHVAYLHRGRAFWVQVDDDVHLQLPSQRAQALDEAEAQLLVALARRDGQLPRQ